MTPIKRIEEILEKYNVSKEDKHHIKMIVHSATFNTKFMAAMRSAVAKDLLNNQNERLNPLIDYYNKLASEKQSNDRP